MWVLYAFGSALFSGLTAILAKIGIKDVNSNVATAIRTVVITLFAWTIVIATSSYSQIGSISPSTLVFLVLSGFATGASWLFYFKALQIGDVNKVTPIDKSSVVLTMLLGMLFLNEAITPVKMIGLLGIGIGTYLMIEQKKTKTPHVERKTWILYAVLSAVFASLTAILGKIGIEGVDSNLGTAIRTIVVLVMAWGIVFLTRPQRNTTAIPRRSLVFLILSGVTTSLAWLSYYHALQTGPASVVVPIDKLSIVVAVGFAYLVLHEKLTRKSFFGLVLIVVSTLALLI